MSAVEVDQLTIRYGDKVAVDALSFRAEPGAITVVLGPNGAGKTSTIECLEGYLAPTSGRVSIGGLDPIADRRRLRSTVGIMLQAGGVYPAIRVGEIVSLFGAYYPDPIDSGELLDRVGLAAMRRSTWRSLSGGEQQRLSLALALIGRPEVAFLDEPTAGVDIRGKQVIRDVVADLRTDGVTVVLTTHDLEEVEQLADRIVIVDHGRVVADGTPDELLDAGAAASFDFRADPGLDVDDLGRALEAPVVEISAGDYRVETSPTPAIVAAATRWLADHDQLLDDLRAGRRRLDEVFLSLTDEPAPEADPPRRARRRKRS